MRVYMFLLKLVYNVVAFTTHHQNLAIWKNSSLKSGEFGPFFLEKSFVLVEIVKKFTSKRSVGCHNHFIAPQVKHWVWFRVVSQLVNHQRTTLIILIMRAYVSLLKLFYNVVTSYIWSLSVSITLQWKVIVNVVLHHARFQAYFPLPHYHHKLSCANKIWVTSHFVVVIGESDVFTELHVQQTVTYKLMARDPKGI